MNRAQKLAATALRVKVDRTCPRCHVHAYHFGNHFGIKNLILCARCGHEWRGRIRADEQAPPLEAGQHIGDTA